MKSNDNIITSARYRTKNKDYTYAEATDTYSAGVSTELFIDALNDAQDHLQAKLTSASTNLFVQEDTITVVADQQDYTLTARIFGGINFIALLYNSENNTTDYGIPLRQQQPRDKRFFTGYPQYYVPHKDGFSLVPIPESGTGYIKAMYYKEVPDLDIIRGRVNGTPATTDIVLKASPTPHQGKIEAADYICISDIDGNIMMLNGVFDSYAGTTITLAANVSTYLTGSYTLADLANGYVTVGKHTTSKSQLPDTCERYLRTYVQKRVMTSRESNTAIEEDAELVKMEADILEVYNDETRDVDEFPLLDFELLI